MKTVQFGRIKNGQLNYQTDSQEKNTTTAMFIDARELDQGQHIEADICIIGAGAAGITVWYNWPVWTAKNQRQLENKG